MVDGVLTGEERNVIIKRAMLEGHDPAEVNLLLDAEVQKIRQRKQANAPKVNKCPACGEILPPLTGICPTCGKNLNEGDCSCVADRGDDRWNVLDSLRKDKEDNGVS